MSRKKKHDEEITYNYEVSIMQLDDDFNPVEYQTGLFEKYEDALQVLAYKELEHNSICYLRKLVGNEYKTIITRYSDYVNM